MSIFGSPISSQNAHVLLPSFFSIKDAFISFMEKHYNRPLHNKMHTPHTRKVSV
jgi:hypothetical protein